MENSNATATQRQDNVPAASPLKRFNQVIVNESTQKYLTQVLGRKKDQFVNNLTALVANDANLQGCSPMSLVYAGIKATALDFPLDNNLGFAYVIPYNNRKKVNGVDTVVKEAQLQWGYRAFVQLAIRTGQFRTIHVTDVREGEITGSDLLTGEMTFSMVWDRLSKPVVGYVAYFELTNGFRKSLYMTVDELKAHALRYSKTYSSKYEAIRNGSKWTTDFDAMAKKTVLKLLLSKFAPLSVDMREAVRTDQAVFGERGEAEYADAPDEQEQAEAAVEGRKEGMRQAEAPKPDMP